MEIVELSERSSDVITKLIALWKASVVATHTFLSAKEIDDIKPEVGSGLRAVETLIAVLGKDGKFLAFMGIENRRLEMLFVDPQMIGKGIGRKLVEYGIQKHRINELTVNEQNPRAVGFYEHLGFRTYKQTNTDEQGRPYPLLYMRI